MTRAVYGWNWMRRGVTDINVYMNGGCRHDNGAHGRTENSGMRIVGVGVLQDLLEKDFNFFLGSVSSAISEGCC